VIRNSRFEGLANLRALRENFQRSRICFVFFKVVGRIVDVAKIASGKGTRERRRLRKLYGGRIWKKLKGTAIVELSDGTMCLAELHWYEAHGVGKRELKIKRILQIQ
jgi:hypothetical protein